MGCAMVDQILNTFEPYPNIKAIVSTCANNGYDSDIDKIVAVDSWHLLATQRAVSKVFCQQAQCGPANIEGTSAGKTPILGITQRWRVAETNGNHTQPRLGKCFAANYCPNPVFWGSVLVFKKLQLSAYLDVWVHRFGFEAKHVANFRWHEILKRFVL